MGKLKSRNSRLSVSTGAGAALSGLWAVARGAVDAATLPADANNAVRAMLEVPALVPYAVLAVMVVLLAWSFWPKDDGDDGDKGDDPDRSGGTYTQNSSGSGDNTMNF